MPGLASRRPELVLIGVTALWGATFVITKDVVRDSPPLPYLAARFGLASLVLVAWFPRALRPSRLLLRDALVLGLLQALGLLVQVYGQLYTTASKSAFVTAFCTALTPVVAFLVYRERPAAGQLLGVLLATVGLAFLTYPAGGVAWNLGDLLTVVSAAIYAFVIVETARRASSHGAGPLTALQTVVSALLFLVLLGVAHGGLALLPGDAAPRLIAIERRPIILGGRLLAEIAFMTLACTVLTFLGQIWAMARMTATHAAVVFSLEPVFALALALAVEGMAEWPGTRGGLGALLVLAGIIAAELRRPRTIAAAPGLD